MLKGSTEQLYEARAFGRRSGGGLRPAVVVIDLQVGLTRPGLPLYGNHDDAIEATMQLLEGAREGGIPIIFTLVAYQQAEIASACYPILLKMPAMGGLLLGSPSVEIDHRLAPQEDDFVIAKKGQSAFIGTPVAQILVGLGIDTLVVCGANTSGCVRGTVMDATTLGYRVMLPQECLGDVTKAVHDSNMFDMDAKNADTVSLVDALSYLNGVTRSPTLPG